MIKEKKDRELLVSSRNGASQYWCEVEERSGIIK